MSNIIRNVLSRFGEDRAKVREFIANINTDSLVSSAVRATVEEIQYRWLPNGINGVLAPLGSNSPASFKAGLAVLNDGLQAYSEDVINGAIDDLQMVVSSALTPINNGRQLKSAIRTAKSSVDLSTQNAADRLDTLVAEWEGRFPAAKTRNDDQIVDHFRSQMRTVVLMKDKFAVDSNVAKELCNIMGGVNRTYTPLAAESTNMIVPLANTAGNMIPTATPLLWHGNAAGTCVNCPVSSTRVFGVDAITSAMDNPLYQVGIGGIEVSFKVVLYIDDPDNSGGEVVRAAANFASTGSLALTTFNTAVAASLNFTKNGTTTLSSSLMNGVERMFSDGILSRSYVCSVKVPSDSDLDSYGIVSLAIGAMGNNFIAYDVDIVDVRQIIPCVNGTVLTDPSGNPMGGLTKLSQALGSLSYRSAMLVDYATGLGDLLYYNSLFEKFNASSDNATLSSMVQDLAAKLSVTGSGELGLDVIYSTRFWFTGDFEGGQLTNAQAVKLYKFFMDSCLDNLTQMASNEEFLHWYADDNLSGEYSA